MLPDEDKRSEAFSATAPNLRSVEYFDTISAEYADAYCAKNSRASYFFSKRKEIVLDLLQQKNGGVILDAGCGPGVYAGECLRRGFRYYGLDASPEMIAQADQKYGNSKDASFLVGSIESLPFQDNSFDVVLGLGVLEYIERAAVPLTLAEFRRVLKPGGVLIISVLNRSSFYWLWTDWCYPPLRYCYKNTKALLDGSKWLKFTEAKGEGFPTHKFRMPAIKKFIGAPYFKSVEHAYFAVGIVPQPLDIWLPSRIVIGQSVLERLVGVRGFSWLARAYLITATRKNLEATESELEPRP